MIMRVDKMIGNANLDTRKNIKKKIIYKDK